MREEKYTLTKQDELKWIDLLYKDLTGERIFFAGYYFYLSQIPKFLDIETQLKWKINHATEIINVNDTIIQENGLNERTTGLQKANDALSKLINNIYTEITCYDEDGKELKIPCMYEEFNCVLKYLQNLKQEVEFFKKFCIDGLDSEERNEDKNAFLWFINDYCDDIRNKFRNC